jgi:hypothetical protein
VVLEEALQAPSVALGHVWQKGQAPVILLEHAKPANLHVGAQLVGPPVDDIVVIVIVYDVVELRRGRVALASAGRVDPPLDHDPAVQVVDGQIGIAVFVSVLAGTRPFPLYPLQVPRMVMRRRRSPCGIETPHLSAAHPVSFPNIQTISPSPR